MKFIHTADWHLGNSMYDLDRTEEINSFFVFLRKSIIDNEVETLLISGDVFDNINPSNEVRKMYFDFLAGLSETCCKNIIITGGNHDSASMLEAPKKILGNQNIHVIGSVSNKSVEDMVFEIKDATGNDCGICCAIPYVREVELRNYDTASETEDSESLKEKSFIDRTYARLYSLAMERAAVLDQGRNLPVICTGHLYAADLEGRLSKVEPGTLMDDGTRSIDIIGTLGFVSQSVFPENCDYVALGHIHYTTRVGGNPKIRYSGSPFVLGFDEANIRRNFLLCQIDEKKSLEVKEIEIPSFCRFKRLEGSVDEIRSQIKKLDQEKKDVPVYAEICYVPEPGVNAHECLREDLEGISFEVISWKQKRNESSYVSSVFSDELEDAAELDEDEILRQFILYKTGITPDDPEAEKILKEYLPLLQKAAKEAE